MQWKKKSAHWQAHWEGKMLFSIDGSKENMDRIATIVTENCQEKLLSIPNMVNGIQEGDSQVNTSVEVR